MGLVEDRLGFHSVHGMARLLLQLHGTAAWYVADKRSGDCMEFGNKSEAIAWQNVRLIISEMELKKRLPACKIH